MRVLLTNDDGTASEGLWALARAVRDRGHEVVVVAPVTNQSGTAASLGAGNFFDPIVMTRVENDEHTHAWGMDATPAKCVMVAVETGMVGPIDAVASGINPGWNHGRAVLHSGTVGAALSAANVGVPALAVSIGAWDAEKVEHWDSAGRLAAALLDVAVAHPGLVVNLNLPDEPLDNMKVVEAPLAKQWPARVTLDGPFPPPQGQLRVTWALTPVEGDGTSDAEILEAGGAATVSLLGPLGGITAGFQAASAKDLLAGTASFEGRGGEGH